MKRLLFLLLLIPFLAALTTPEVEITSEPSHHLALENESIRVFKVEVAPHASTLMHRHRHDYFFVTLGDAHVSNEVEGKPPVDLNLADGETRFVPGNFAHVAKNLSDQPFRNATIELMQDEKLRQTPSHWPEENGVKTFPGGRIMTLFVKDGVRVSEVNLEPGAIVPSHHHDGPHLLVAVSDLDIRSDVEGMGPMPGKFKSGEVKWLPGGYTHTLTNVGKSPARFVTVEFYALLTNGLPGETKPTRCSLAVRRSLSFEAEAAARRLRSFAIFSARVRRRRISGRRLGADIKFSLVFSDGAQRCDRGTQESDIRSAARWRPRLCALDRRIRRLRPIAAANQYWQPRIFHEPRVLKRKFTHKESRTAIGLDPARMAAVSAEAGVGIGMDQRVD